MIFDKAIIVIVNIIGSIMFMIIIIVVRYNMSLRELAENKMIFDDELEQVLIKANAIYSSQVPQSWNGSGNLIKYECQY